jgi:hypothetical protein
VPLREINLQQNELHGNLRKPCLSQAGIPARGGERELCGIPHLRRPAGFLLPCPPRAGAPGQARLQGRQDLESAEGHDPGRLSGRARLPRARARTCLAESGVHPKGGQHGRARQQDAGPGEGAAGHGHGHRQDPHGDRAGGPAAAGGLGEAGAVPGRPGVIGESGAERVQDASAGVQPGEPGDRKGEGGSMSAPIRR